MTTVEQVRQALTGVMDPELHRNIVELGMVRDVEIDFHLKKTEGDADEVVGTITCSLPGELRPHAPAAFVASKPECPAFDEYFYEIRFAQDGKAETR